MDLSQTTLLPPLDAFVPGVLPLFALRVRGSEHLFSVRLCPCLFIHVSDSACWQAQASSALEADLFAPPTWILWIDSRQSLI
jgi:hypothetical protein